ncbi:hypothetical protein EVAR_840_1 [Eumeta japonica]|uniref:Uncharacterized protein n=1 Tax=Eumeta variegata TaxID=151549 RepID=A0A4C1SDR0_EUMVA|nr:hypothetical protein EVAR_840_1 [Eumeta japonica]
MGVVLSAEERVPERNLVIVVRRHFLECNRFRHTSYFLTFRMTPQAHSSRGKLLMLRMRAGTSGGLKRKGGRGYTETKRNVLFLKGSRKINQCRICARARQ